jgi:crotonobetainyl-CoA:carnitine CoA-transferase CaiB-like acyl-CoA transferase
LAFGFQDLLSDPALASNNLRVGQRATLIPELKRRLADYRASDLAAIFEREGLPYAPIIRPEQLFDDPHLHATGGLADVKLTDGPRTGDTARAALLPLSLNGERLGVRRHPPTPGQHTEALLRDLGLSSDKIEALKAAGSVR